MGAGMLGGGGCVLPAAALGEIEPDAVWGRRGLSDGRLLKPRAITIDAADQLYLVDTTGRIQVFDADGRLLRLWKTPETEFGRPTGLGVTPDERLLVADTHYFRVLVYSLEGELLEAEIIGGESGYQPGQFAFVTDAVRDRQGVTYVGEYGDSDRIQRFDPDGQVIDWWGGTGREPGKFVRPQCLVLSADERTLWIADACNHRVQLFDVSVSPPHQIGLWGSEGDQPGQLYYPYGLVLAPDETVYVCEYGNQRVQHFTRDGQHLGLLGGPGHDEGQFYQPWGLVLDSRNRLFVLDSNNHRVQRYVL
jgi:sugar lactone lactonase YvrE